MLKDTYVFLYTIVFSINWRRKTKNEPCDEYDGIMIKSNYNLRDNEINEFHYALSKSMTNSSRKCYKVIIHLRLW